jgi:hypothetical protein
LAVELVTQGGARVLDPQHVHNKDELFAFANAKDLVTSLEHAEAEAASARAAAAAARKRARVLEDVGQKGKAIGSFFTRAAKAASEQFRDSQGRLRNVTASTGRKEMAPNVCDKDELASNGKNEMAPNVHDRDELITKLAPPKYAKQSDWNEQSKAAVAGSQVKDASTSSDGGGEGRSIDDPQETSAMLTSGGESYRDMHVSNPRGVDPQDVESHSHSATAQNGEPVRKTEQPSAPRRLVGGLASAMWRGGKALAGAVLVPVGKAAYRQGVKSGKAAANALIDKEKRRRGEK